MPAFSLATLIRALLVWLVIIAAESISGAIRNLLTTPETDFALRQAAVFLGAAMIFAITWLLMGWMRIHTARGALAVGVLWVVLTVGFEIVIGRLMGLSWARIGSDYDLAHGGLMPLGLAFMALTPWAVRRFRFRRSLETL